MKMNVRQLANRLEELLKLTVPEHITYVTYRPSHGVKVEVIHSGKAHTYDAGNNWTTCDMTARQITRDYMAARYPKEKAQDA